MKSLVEYLNETLIKNKGSKGLEVIYSERNGIDLKTISEDEFVEMMTQDATEAYDSWRQDHKIADQLERNRQQFIKNYMKKAQEYAEYKWKTENKRQEYIEKAKEAVQKEVESYYGAHERGVNFRAITYISNSYPGCADINPLQIKERDLRSLLNELRRSKWWVGATGWKFTARVWNGDSRCDGLFIEPISKSFSWDEYRKERKASDDAISSFLADLKYFGD